jgi:hypothetical protein
MSDRDQTLVESLGIPVAQLAIALEKSRQTVNRGIHGAADYLKPADLVKALEVWRASNAPLYAVAKAKICEIYPELAVSILEAARSGSSVAFSVDVPGEYWFICGDFVGFRNSLQVCAKDLETLCALEDAQVKLFINERDYFAAQRLASRFQEYNAHAVLCTNVDLRLFPSTLLRMDYDDNIDLFGVSDQGFTALSRQEATRLRVSVQEFFLQPNMNPGLQRVDAN